MKNFRMVFRSVLILALAIFGSQSARAANYTVVMSSFAYSPTTLTIGVGDQVTWTNVSTGLGSTHTVTRGDAFCGTNGFSGSFWNSGNVASRATYSFTFTNFAAGTYSYLCLPHCTQLNMKGTIVITNSANASPSVSLTNPTSGAALVAPANITLGAHANDPDGSVTNVQLFSGGALVASLAGVPYTFTLSNLAAGNYSFMATAKDNFGAGSTSAVVNVFVLTNAVLSAPLQAGGQFQLTITGIAGQTYATEVSSNLLTWEVIATNLAPANVFNITDTTSTNILQRFYRSRQNY